MFDKQVVIVSKFSPVWSCSENREFFEQRGYILFDWPKGLSCMRINGISSLISDMAFNSSAAEMLPFSDP